MKQILVAEDDANIRKGLVATLESEGYSVTAAVDGKEALAEVASRQFSLILLDLMMPEVSGYDVCREIRRFDSKTPIIMLTAKGEEIDKVLGLELGADDYVTKPFGIRELLARVAAALRRSDAGSASEPGATAGTCKTFVFGDGQVDQAKYRFVRGDGEVTLTGRELALLAVFHAHPDEVLTRDMLLNQVWGIDYQGTTRTLDQHIAQLRKKVEVDPAEPTWIRTVHGAGYRYVP